MGKQVHMKEKNLLENNLTRNIKCHKHVSTPLTRQTIPGNTFFFLNNNNNNNKVIRKKKL